jgi:nitrate/TMAO reductase-like tetraheme cytochrome c subunit
MKRFNLSTRVRWVIYSSTLALALGLIAIVLVAEASSQPQFCASCHLMEPYFESWQTSSHSDVPCVDCHIPPGVTNEIRKKWEALSMVTSYFTGTYGTNPWAEIDDASCLRCHQRRLLSGQELFADVVFDHQPHLTELRQGMKLRCTSCHSQIVQGLHITVTTSTCILCHFKGENSGEDTSRCTLCHSVPETVIQKGMMTFDHGDVSRFDMDCRWCHSHELTGSGGNVPQERCFTCHNEPSRVAEYENTNLMHQMHVTEHKVDCMDCHLEIQHGEPPNLGVAQTSCESCHRAGHSPQRDLYAGMGGRGVPPMPAPMFTAGVACEGCHFSLPQQEDDTARATEVSCMSCHGARYRSTYLRWQEGVSQRTQLLKRQLQSTARLFSGAEPEQLGDARHNLTLVEEGKGVHNVRYAFALLTRAHEFLNQARGQIGRSGLAIPWPEVPYESTCVQCHQGIEGQSGSQFGREFSHSIHAVEQKLQCQACHRPHEEKLVGEIVSFGAEGCANCHHQGAELDCLQCHSGMTERTVQSFRGEFSHSLHLGMGNACADCHQLESGQPVSLNRELCSMCHP